MSKKRSGLFRLLLSHSKQFNRLSKSSDWMEKPGLPKSCFFLYSTCKLTIFAGYIAECTYNTVNDSQYHSNVNRVQASLS